MKEREKKEIKEHRFDVNRKERNQRHESPHNRICTARMRCLRLFKCPWFSDNDNRQFITITITTSVRERRGGEKKKKSEATAVVVIVAVVLSSCLAFCVHVCARVLRFGVGGFDILSPLNVTL